MATWTQITKNTAVWTNLTKNSPSSLLTELGDRILLEQGGALILESSVGSGWENQTKN